MRGKHDSLRNANQYLEFMESRIVLVTGANRGLGLAVCKSLLKNGHRVIATSRKEEQRDGLAVQLSPLGDFNYAKVDVQNEEDVTKCFLQVESKFEHLDCLVNNAGILYNNTVQKTSSQELLDVFRTNVMGPFLMNKTFVPLLANSGDAKIINVTSQLGSLANSGPDFAAYRISKTALNSLTRLLHHELNEFKIKVYSVCPGWVHTDMGGPRAPRTPAEGASSILFPFYNEVDSGSYIQDGNVLPW